MAKKAEIFTKECKECGTPAIKNSTVCTNCGAELKTSLGMKKVYPIEQDQIKLVRSVINDGNFGDRNEFLFLFLLNTALRIGDALKVKVGMVRDKEYLEIIEQKTGKTKKFKMSSFLKQTINEYTKDMSSGEYLFQSRKHDIKGGNKAISRIHAHRIFKDAADKIDIKNFGCHSARKTYARLIYEKTNDISFVMRLLNHSSEAMTLKYLHLTEEKDDRLIMDFSLS